MLIPTYPIDTARRFAHHALSALFQSARAESTTCSERKSYAMYEQTPYEPFYDFPCSPTFRAYEAEITHGEVVASQMYPHYQKEAVELSRAEETHPAQGNGLRNIQSELFRLKAQMTQQSNKLESHLETSRNWVRRDRL